MLLWLGGGWDDLQPSMSDYYYYQDGKMRDVFVGILCAIGVFLILYKGWEKLENRLLNAAGFFAIGVAIFPMGWKPFPIFGVNVTFHYICAALLFVCMYFVCKKCAPNTTDKLKDPDRREDYKKWYKRLAASMLFVPVIAFILEAVLRRGDIYTFLVEALAVEVFALYWLVKDCELRVSGYEEREEFALPSTSPALKKLTKGQSHRVEDVDPREYYYPTGLEVTAGQTYTFEAEGKWKDAFLKECDANGWGGKLNPLVIFNRVSLVPVFYLCGNIGKKHGTKFHIGTKRENWKVPDTVNKSTDHQLYLFANDAPIAYCNNHRVPGSPLKVTITLISDAMDDT